MTDKEGHKGYKISYTCDAGHSTPSEFLNHAVYERLRQLKMVECAICGSRQVTTDLARPNVNTGKSRQRAAPQPAPIFEDVGKKFSTEARKIADGEVPARNIVGTGTESEIRELVRDGIPFGILPPPPALN